MNNRYYSNLLVYLKHNPRPDSVQWEKIGRNDRRHLILNAYHRFASTQTEKISMELAVSSLRMINDWYSHQKDIKKLLEPQHIDKEVHDL